MALDVVHVLLLPFVGVYRSFSVVQDNKYRYYEYDAFYGFLTLKVATCSLWTHKNTSIIRFADVIRQQTS